MSERAFREIGWVTRCQPWHKFRVTPDAKLKSSPNVSKSWPKCKQSSLTWKILLFIAIYHAFVKVRERGNRKENCKTTKMLLDVVTFSRRIISNRIKRRSVENVDKVIQNVNTMHLMTSCRKVKRKNFEFIVKLALMDDLT